MKLSNNLRKDFRSVKHLLRQCHDNFTNRTFEKLLIQY